MSKLPGLGSLEKMQIVHLVIGGVICLFTTLLLFDLAQNVLLQILMNLGFVGVMVYNESQIATAAFRFGIAYLVGGFIGGLYTGYQIYDFKVILLISTIISTFGFALLLLLLANYPLNVNFIGLVMLQLLGNTFGLYLGGYAIN
jgi:hypothetical protein